jgi:MFS transporter, DHA1 family, tetracycline resistance protein
MGVSSRLESGIGLAATAAMPGRADSQSASARTIAFATLACTVAIDGVAYALVLPVLPFAVSRLGGGAAATAAAFSLFSLCQLCASPLLGRLSDRIGRRPVLVLSQAGSALGFLMLALARGLPMLLGARLVDGATAGNLAVVNAAVCDLYEPDRWSERFSILNVASGLGLLCGLLLAGLLGGDAIGTPAVVACLLATATVLTSLRVRLPGVRRVGAIAAPPATTARPAMRVLVLAHLLFVALATGLPVLLHAALGLPQRSALLASAAGIVLGGGLQVWLGRRATAAGDRPTRAAFVMVAAGGLVMLGGLRGGLGVILVGEVLSVAGLLRGLALATAGLGRIDPGLGAGASMGLAQRCAAVGQLLGPVLGFAALALDNLAWCLLVVALGAAGALVSAPWIGTRPGSATNHRTDPESSR